MHRSLMIAALAATFAVSVAAAEPSKAPAPQASQPANRPAELLLASSEIRAPDQQQSEGQVAPPVKRPRASRVTTCRCGGQTPQQP